ncbi:hypothetical protein BXZ70DRAFT_727423 [Cristinia sonorae]|uniref:Uncharacterized protein n=1 Tax=Cristinia sonorae TaxID=1940300 RepID=A0A8K0XS41_9AGAR|nr:hypothetical protein BXZ70DRAFT_727423 [Cristinia sonorae]
MSMSDVAASRTRGLRNPGIADKRIARCIISRNVGVIRQVGKPCEIAIGIFDLPITRIHTGNTPRDIEGLFCSRTHTCTCVDSDIFLGGDVLGRFGVRVYCVPQRYRISLFLETSTLRMRSGPPMAEVLDRTVGDTANHSLGKQERGMAVHPTTAFAFSGTAMAVISDFRIRQVRQPVSNHRTSTKNITQKTSSIVPLIWTSLFSTMNGITRMMVVRRNRWFCRDLDSPFVAVKWWYTLLPWALTRSQQSGAPKRSWTRDTERRSITRR